MAINLISLDKIDSNNLPLKRIHKGIPFPVAVSWMSLQVHGVFVHEETWCVVLSYQTTAYRGKLEIYPLVQSLAGIKAIRLYLGFYEPEGDTHRYVYLE